MRKLCRCGLPSVQDRSLCSDCAAKSRARNRDMRNQRPREFCGTQYGTPKYDELRMSCARDRLLRNEAVSVLTERYCVDKETIFRLVCELGPMVVKEQASTRKGA
jgi:hypothetical protein